MHDLRVSIGALLVLGLFTGCDSGSPAEPDGPSLVEVQAQVFTPSCGGCHSGDSPAAGLDLAAGRSYEQTVDVPSVQVPELLRVQPGRPSDSYLFIKITGDDRMASGTFQMPIGGELSNDQIRMVEEWIAGGAKP